VTMLPLTDDTVPRIRSGTGAAIAVAADNKETVVARPRVRFIIYAVTPLMYK
jgi:hypothetical protein